MQKFFVFLTRTMTDSESAVAIVEAENRQAAKEIALTKIDRDKLHWTRNHDFESETAVTSIQDTSEPDELSELDDAELLEPLR